MVIGMELRNSRHSAIASPQADGRNLVLLPIVTLVLWLLALVIGTAGFVLGYPAPHRELGPAAVSKTQIVDVAIPKAVLPAPPPTLASPVPDLTTDSQAPVQIAEPQAPTHVPPTTESQAPALVVALPTPAIAFAVPVEGLARIVDVSSAVYTGRVSGSGSAGGQASAQPSSPPGPPPPPPTVARSSPAAAIPPVTHLTMGEGEGNQPSPEYPSAAASARQQGTVTLRFNVDETGRVTHVDIIAPSRFPLLNRAAASTVRERWHFPPGQPRVYEVPIEFQINE